jgi:hypothetical protein
MTLEKTSGKSKQRERRKKKLASALKANMAKRKGQSKELVKDRTLTGEAAKH